MLREQNYNNRGGEKQKEQRNRGKKDGGHRRKKGKEKEKPIGRGA